MGHHSQEAAGQSQDTPAGWGELGYCGKASLRLRHGGVAPRHHLGDVRRVGRLGHVGGRRVG